MAGQESVVPADCTSDRRSRASARGKSGTIYTEHYWGYSTQRSGGSVEYHVSHEPWQVWVSTTAGFEGDASSLYGVELSHVLQGHPSSAFIADGSQVTVFRGNKLP